MEEIGLGMEAGSPGIVGDPNFSIGQFKQALDGLQVCCAHIGSHRNAQAWPTIRRGALCKLAQGRKQGQDTRKFDERDQPVGTVTACKLLDELRKQ